MTGRSRQRPPSMDDLRRAGAELRLDRFRAGLRAAVCRTRRGRIMWWLSGRYARLIRRASGGAVPARRQLDGDSIPAILSPGRSTTVRPGESILEATERLMHGEDL